MRAAEPLFSLCAAPRIGPVGFTAGETISKQKSSLAIVRQTWDILMLFLGGCSLGAQGGMLACSRAPRREDVFDKTEPQMALNMSITALPASIVAAVLAAAIFSRLSDLPGRQAGQTAVRASIAICSCCFLLLA